MGVLIVVHEFGHFLAAKKSGVKVEIFSIGFGPSIFKKDFKDTQYRISLIPFGGYVKLAGEIEDENTKGEPWEFMSKPIWKRFFILTSGALFNYVLAIVVFIILFTIGMPRLNTKIGGVIGDYPARIAGLEESDKILEVEGKFVLYWEEMVGLIRDSKDGVVNLKVYRQNTGELDFEVVPNTEERKNLFGQMKNIPVIGIYPSGEIINIRYPIVKASVEGIKYTAYLSYVTVRGIWNIIIGNISFKNTVTGPLGIYQITTQAAKAGIIYLLNIIALISMSLAIINLFPFPVLDGGHVLFLLIEKIKGSPLNPKVQQIAIQIGMYFLIFLMMYLFYIDFLRLR